MINDKWSLQNIPPKGDADVAEFAAILFEIAKDEKERLGKPASFLANYALFRGSQNKQQTTGRKGFSPQSGGKSPINLFFANVLRTVANITHRDPTGEVIDLDEEHDNAGEVLTAALKKWWKDTNQREKIRESALEMEVYGLTVEKPVYNKDADYFDILVTDPFSFFSAPGFYRDLAMEAPYICFTYLKYVSQLETEFNVTDIAPDEGYELMGHKREDLKPQVSYQSIGNYADPHTVVSKEQSTSDKKIQRTIAYELWIRDTSETTKKITAPLIDDTTGEQAIDENGELLFTETTQKKKVYPDDIRKITFAKSKDPVNRSGWIVLDDTPNPNINFRYGETVEGDASNTYPWGRLPVYIANSYKDGTSIWGFSAAEQVSDLLEKINLIFTKVVAYVLNVIAPPLILQQHCGITRDMIESSIQKAGRLILMPSIPNARIEFMQIPNLPATFFQVLDLVIQMFDRVYQIEDADRGVNPTGVIAASAIVALQERNAVLMQSKTSSIDAIAEQRSRWAIGLWQNFGLKINTVNIAGVPVTYRGVNYVGRKFNYVVETGSTTPRTSLQREEQAKWLYEVKAIGQQGLLEAINWPNVKEELERTAESQLDQALQILVSAGLPEEEAVELRDYLLSSSVQTTENEGRKPSGTTTTPQVANVPRT